MSTSCRTNPVFVTRQYSGPSYRLQLIFKYDTDIVETSILSGIA